MVRQKPNQQTEPQIVKSVERHFKKLGFSTQREYRIQMGSSRRKADIVIYKPFTLFSNPFFFDDPLDHIAVIVECKAEGKINHGINQLKGYLCATDTRLGVFANSPSPAVWKYYENYGRNNIPEISREDFLSLLHNENQNQEELQRRIQARTEQRVKEAAERLATLKRIEERRELIIDQEANKRITENDFRSTIEINLKTALNNANQKIAFLEEEVKHKRGCLWTSVLVLGIILFIIIANS